MGSQNIKVGEETTGSHGQVGGVSCALHVACGIQMVIVVDAPMMMWQQEKLGKSSSGDLS